MKKKSVVLILCLLLLAGAFVITGCAGNGETLNMACIK